VHVSPRASAFDRDSARFGGTDLPVRSSEQFIEVTYQCQIAPWWVVQPDLQYIVNPGGGIANPTNPATKLGNELVLGLRTIVTF
jgi:porin